MYLLPTHACAIQRCVFISKICHFINDIKRLKGLPDHCVVMTSSGLCCCYYYYHYTVFHITWKRFSSRVDSKDFWADWTPTFGSGSSCHSDIVRHLFREVLCILILCTFSVCVSIKREINMHRHHNVSKTMNLI